MTTEETVDEVTNTIRTQMRTLGVEFHDDVGERIPRGSVQEHRIIAHVARHVAQVVVGKAECHTIKVTSCMCPTSHWPSCPEYPAYLKDA